MDVIAKREPFPHIIINDFFTKKEYSLIWKELTFIAPKMQPPNKTGAGVDEFLNPAKKGSGIFLYDFYSDRTRFSDIHKMTRKLFSVEVMTASNLLDLYFKQFQKVVYDNILLQLYYNGDYYKEHNDDAVFTAVTVLHKTPKLYVGGELIFPQHEYNPNISNNQTIIFPSIIFHEVTEMKLQSNNHEDGRFTISQLCQISPLNVEMR